MRNPSRSRSAKRREFLPGVLALERREAMATLVANMTATPQVLSPPNERYVNVVIVGNVVDSSKKVTPQARFYVSDEYRLDEPTGPVKLTKIFPAVFSFRFVLTLQARRANLDTSGRQYNVTVGSSDSENSQGQTITVLVPHNALKPGQTIAPYPVRHPLKGTKLPPINPPAQSSGVASGIPIFGNLFGGGSGSSGGKKKK